MIKKSLFLIFIFLAFLSFSSTAHAAANIVVSSPVLAANGKTLTATLSGGSGSGYLPATGVTGLTIKTTTNGGATYATSSTSISGTTLTVNLAAFIATGETVTLDLSSSSNLTDGGANSAQGQTAVSVTNNSTKTVSRATDTNSAIAYYGRYTHNVGAGSAYTQLTALGTEVVFVVNGTDANAVIYSTAGSAFTLSVDGGATTTMTAAALNTNVAVPLFSGLAAGDHTVVIKRFYSGGSYYIYSPNTIQTAGGTGVYRAASTSDAIGYGSYLRLGDAGFSSTGNVDNLSSYTASGYSSPSAYAAFSTGNWSNGRFRVMAKTSTLKIWAFLNAENIAYDIDGVQTGTTTVPNTQNWGWVTIASGLDATSFHTYTLTQSKMGVGTTGFFVDAVMLVDSSPSFSSTAPSTLSGLGGFGDSITYGVGVPNDLRQNWLSLTASSTGMMPFNRGISGSTVISSGQSRTSDITSISPEISKNFIMYGINDISAAGTANPTSGFSSAFQTMLTALLSGSTNTKEYVIGILPRSANATTTIASWNGSGNGIQGSVAAVVAARPADASRILFIDSSNWQLNGADGTDYITNYNGDGLHPNALGNALIANRVIPYASTAGYSIAGPSSGTSGTASTAFTVTIASGATFTGDEMITLSDSSHGGTFTPSIGSPAVSSVTVTPTNGLTSFTFTYTPAITGPISLSFTNGQGWVNAGDVTLTAASAPVVSTSTPAPIHIYGSSRSRETISIPATPSSDPTIISWTPALVFTKDLFFSVTDPQVKLLQQYLNAHGFTVAVTGAGSPGHETTYFGKATQAAVIKLQKENNIAPTAGYFGKLTRSWVNAH